MAVTFEGMERRMPKIEKCLAEYGIANLEEARKICNDLGFDPYDIVKGCLLYTSPSPRDRSVSRMPSSA